MNIEAARAAAAEDYPGGPPSAIEFNKVVKEYSRLLLWHANRRLGALPPSEVSAEDIVQETFMRAHQSWDFVVTRASVRGILLFILKQRISHHRTRRFANKRSGWQVPLEDWDGGQQPPDQHARLELAEVAMAVERLKPPLKSLLVDVALGEPLFEIAARDGVSRQAVHAKVGRARLALEREMRRHLVEKEGGE